MNAAYARTLVSHLIEQLAEGTAPWATIWEPGTRYLPYNPVSTRTYRGMNAVWLLAQGAAQGYEDARWLTGRQARSLGGELRPGETGAAIQYWRWREDRLLRDERGEPIRDGDGKQRHLTTQWERPRVFTAMVFNAEQIYGLDPAPERPSLPARERHALAEAIIGNLGVTIEHRRRNIAAYHQPSDTIILPERGQYASADRYHAAALHEAARATGSTGRLNRDLVHPYGSDGYAGEELRAQLASLILGDTLALGHYPHENAAFIQSWITLLTGDPREMFRAAADAERIAGYLHGIAPQLRGDIVASAPTGPSAAIGDPPATGNEALTGARTYIRVPFVEKDDAKKRGARWDQTVHSWYVPPRTPLSSIQRWPRHDPYAESSSPGINPREEFRLALLDAGLQPDGLPEMDGKLRRVPVDGDKRGAKSGAYVGYLDGHPAGYIQNFKSGEARNWKAARAAPPLTEAQRAALRQKAAQRRLKGTSQARKIHTDTGKVLMALIQNSAWADDNHAYLQRKGVRAHGALINRTGPVEIFAGDETPQRFNKKGDLILPLQSPDGYLIGAQSIDGAGRKSFARGGVLFGGFFAIGDWSRKPETILIAEGFATAATVHELTGLPAIVAFTAGNLEPVAAALRQREPDAQLIIAGDNDHRREQELDRYGRPKTNAGRLAAEKAAMSVGGKVMVSEFKPADDGSDWNDLLRLRGREGILTQWRSLDRATTADEQNPVPSRIPADTILEPRKLSTRGRR